MLLPSKTNGNLFTAASGKTRYRFSGPVIDTAKFHNICVSLLSQLLGRLFAPVTAAAVNKD